MLRSEAPKSRVSGPSSSITSRVSRKKPRRRPLSRPARAERSAQLPAPSASSPNQSTSGPASTMMCRAAWAKPSAPLVARSRNCTFVPITRSRSRLKAGAPTICPSSAPRRPSTAPVCRAAVRRMPVVRGVIAACRPWFKPGKRPRWASRWIAFSSGRTSRLIVCAKRRASGVSFASAASLPPIAAGRSFSASLATMAPCPIAVIAAAAPRPAPARGPSAPPSAIAPPAAAESP